MRLFLALSLLFIVFGCGIEKTNPERIVKGETGRRLDSLLTPYLEELRARTDNTAGLAIAVTKGEDIIFSRTFGYAQIENQKKVDSNTGFHIASVSKPFCAIAVAILIQEKKLALDDLVVEHLPEFTMAGSGHDLITIKHILTHTSGIPANIAPDDWTHPSFGPNAMEENLNIVRSHELDFEPGTEFSYSNSAFDILGILISRVSGVPFHEFIEQKIFAPVGMRNTRFIRPGDHIPEEWASSYSYGLSTQAWSPFPYNERLFPSSGVIASLRDMCLWGQFHAGEGTINGKEILDKEHFELVTTPFYDTPWGDQIGLSWFLQSYLDRPIIMHTGYDTGFEAIVYIYPGDNISIIVLTNRDFSRSGRIINAISEVLFEEIPKPYSVSAKYKFAQAYREQGIEQAILRWEELREDTLDSYFTDDEDILTTGAILENGQHWKESKEILEYYLTLDSNSTYAWRLLGNATLQLGDTTTAKRYYQQTLKINPEYEKGRIALENLEK